MFITIVCSTIAIAASGLLVRWLLNRKESVLEITWREFAIGMAIATLVLSPIIGFVGFRMARNNLVTFTEFWNGWELHAAKIDIACTRDGPCKWEYDCDPYIVMVSYSCNCNKDGCDTCYRPETRYHSCPYVTTESNYTVATTLEDFDIAKHRFPDNPDSHRWRKSISVPKRVSENAGVGAPQFWLDAKKRIESNDPGPVTVRKNYENYILASDQTILHQFSSDIEQLKNAGLLPSIQKNIYTFYLADKVYFVGSNPKNTREWQNALRKLNAAFGTELQGDLHLVLVNNELVNRNPDAYALALKAYWQDKSVFGKDCLSKNGMLVIVGTRDGATVSWARAFTGMPMGNELLTTVVADRLQGTLFTPDAILGTTRAEFKTPNKNALHTATSIRNVHGNGVIERALWGLDNPKTKFTRVSMGGDNDRDGTGNSYLYLKGEIQPTTSQRAWITLVEFIFSTGVWWAAAFIGERKRSSTGRPYRY